MTRLKLLLIFQKTSLRYATSLTINYIFFLLHQNGKSIAVQLNKRKLNASIAGSNLPLYIILSDLHLWSRIYSLDPRTLHFRVAPESSIKIVPLRCCFDCGASMCVRWVVSTLYYRLCFIAGDGEIGNTQTRLRYISECDDETGLCSSG